MNQNNKSLSIAAFALVGMLACVKEIPQETSPHETPGVTVTLSTTVNLPEDTKALTPEGVKTFAADEQIAVVYKNTSGNTVKVNSEALKSTDITSGGTSATFTVTLTNPDREQDVTYIYPASMAKSDGDINYEALGTQDGILDHLADNLDLATYTGAWIGGTSLPSGTLENQLAILAITLKSSDGASVINNEISRLTLFAGTQSYVVTRTPAEGTIYIAIQPTSGTNIQLVAQSAARYYTKSLTDKTYAANNGYPVAFRMAALPEGSLPGKFTVASGKQVYFSKGNLQATYNGFAWTWAFATHQWDYIGENVANTNIGSTGTVDLFGWSSSETNYGISDSVTVGDYSGDFVDWGNNIGSGWHTLSSTEWTYLFGHNTSGWSTIHGIGGYVIRPDDVITAVASSYTVIEWETEEANGSVFLPAAGYRHGNYVIYEGNEGYYHSSTPSGNNTYMVCFYSGYVTPNDNGFSRDFGLSVRLVFPCTPSL